MMLEVWNVKLENLERRIKMGKVMKTAFALLLVLGCTNNVAFAAMKIERNFPVPLIREEIETVGLNGNVRIAAGDCVTLGIDNDIPEINARIVNLSDMAYMTLDESKNIVEGNLGWLRATTSISWSVNANILKKANTTFPMEAGECVTINCSYSPRSAEVEFGLIAPNNRFYYLPGEEGSINQAIRIEERGEYRFGVYNKSSTTVSVTGFIEY